MRSILAYTRQQWGENQRNDYREALNRSFDSLRANPELGRARDDLPPGVRSLVVRQHIVFYRLEADTIRVLRVLHGRMNAATHLGE